MATYLIQPNITNEMVKKTFEYLVYAEIQKSRSTGCTEELDGNQDGFIMCLSILFGEASDSDFDKAYREGKGWPQVIEQIIDEELSELAVLVSLEEIDWDLIQSKISTGVENFILNHWQDVLTSIRSL